MRFIYASHVLEHLDYPGEAEFFAKECYRSLIPGGALRVIVPGIEKIIRAYVDDDEGFFAVQASMHPAECTTKLGHLMFALQQGGEHKYGYDFETMSKLLRRAGFAQIVQSDCNASNFEELRIDYRNITDNHGRCQRGSHPGIEACRRLPLHGLIHDGISPIDRFRLVTDDRHATDRGTPARSNVLTADRRMWTKARG